MEMTFHAARHLWLEDDDSRVLSADGIDWGEIYTARFANRLPGLWINCLIPDVLSLSSR